MNQPFDTKCAQLDDLLGVGRSFDMVSRELYVGGRRAKMWVVNGYAKDMLLERAVEKLQEVETLDGISGVDELLRRYITVCDAGTSRDRMQAVTDVFAGKTLLIIDGFSGGILLDAKTFPTRSVQEPDAGKVLRGSHDGFVESIMENAALLRLRIRDPALTLERIRLGGRSQCDVALCYMEGRADAKTLSQLREKLRRIDLRSVSMSQETIAEAIAPKQWYNPFPKVRYTERPDVATASVMEGDILVLIDNTPVVMLLPVSLLRFNEEINDYYFPPLVGTYLRIIRFFVMLLNVVITPVVSAGHGARRPAGALGLPAGGGGVRRAAGFTAAAGGADYRRAEAGVPEYARCAGQLLQHAGRADPGRFRGAVPMAGAGGAGIYGLCSGEQLCPAQL